ncbi:uncharacterized protein CYBJADRAFT_18968 [Cyberlindnera jadinii NRRL Y-1542]|uniref:Uncharacterized protein n=1 Tax=Cyberlindnera jadinii (strain ATCC 18201 / CBS 1600 / BCRC 20928 / JCM 3617 / NBRC 0987 / NRRL Y-1542) TaxID=983966 RepID=A0A1E4RYB6_CYBJN|nr:hypothetical protein CYBJADRAFT_18968 [Cyberlindnera jadinii NRRL Y-1542]ODV72258.1 hypothetical protein CYBJADRAFT_18968 [Cyberlindnera jadinii NRRL Y-1542]
MCVYIFVLFVLESHTSRNSSDWVICTDRTTVCCLVNFMITATQRCIVLNFNSHVLYVLCSFVQLCTAITSHHLYIATIWPQ